MIERRIVLTPETPTEAILAKCHAYGDVIIGLASDSDQADRMTELEAVQADVLVVNRDAEDYHKQIDFPKDWLRDAGILVVHESNSPRSDYDFDH